MSDASAAMFNRVAADYDRLWTRTTVGRMQREAVWRNLAPLLEAGQRVLDAGCGTGEDALWLARGGASVSAIDVSGEMVRIARQRGVDARVCSVEDMNSIEEQFDGVISNFGVLNCVPVAEWRQHFAGVVRPGGYLAICLINRFCLWETIWYAMRGQVRKAARRWRGTAIADDHMQIHYPSVNSIVNALAPAFRLTGAVGIGIFVPPSYVRGLPDGLLRALTAIDARLESTAPFRMLADHRMLVFRA